MIILEVFLDLFFRLFKNFIFNFIYFLLNSSISTCPNSSNYMFRARCEIILTGAIDVATRVRSNILPAWAVVATNALL